MSTVIATKTFTLEVVDLATCAGNPANIQDAVWVETAPTPIGTFTAPHLDATFSSPTVGPDTHDLAFQPVAILCNPTAESYGFTVRIDTFLQTVATGLKGFDATLYFDGVPVPGQSIAYSTPGNHSNTLLGTMPPGIHSIKLVLDGHYDDVIVLPIISGTITVRPLLTP